jgi:hypothetical protein
MNSKTDVLLQFPQILQLEPQTLFSPLTYIGAAGFEDRAMSFLDWAISRKISIDNAIAIEYRPYYETNRVQLFKEKLSKVKAEVRWTIFDRYDPQAFSKAILPILKSLNSEHILVDVSAMSKFLVIIILQALRDRPNRLTIIYTEADVYHPTKDEFELKKKELGMVPDFLTTDVYKILAVSSLSSVSMQSHPMLLLAFPTFNRSEIVALYNELSPKCMILFEGVPHEEQDKWRLEAIREINERITTSPDYTIEQRVLSTFDYRANIKMLEDVYQDYSCMNKIVLSPTGSKLQTVAVFMFKQLHPDVQIVYPVTKSFIGEYSEKCRAIWSISFDSFSEFVRLLDTYRRLT